MSKIPIDKTVKAYQLICNRSNDPEKKKMVRSIDEAYEELKGLGEDAFVVKYREASNEIRRRICKELLENADSKLDDVNFSPFDDTSNLEKGIKLSIETENQRKLLEMAKLLEKVNVNDLKKLIDLSTNQSNTSRVDPFVDDSFADNVPKPLTNKQVRTVVNTEGVKNTRLPFSSKLTDSSSNTLQFEPITPIQREYSHESIPNYIRCFKALNKRIDHYCIVPNVSATYDDISHKELSLATCVILYLWIVKDKESIKPRAERTLGVEAHKMLYFYEISGINTVITDLYNTIRRQNKSGDDLTRIESIANRFKIQIECIYGGGSKILGANKANIMTVVLIGEQWVIDYGISECGRCPGDDCRVISFIDMFKSLKITYDDYQLALSNKLIEHNPIYDDLFGKPVAKKFITDSFDLF